MKKNVCLRKMCIFQGEAMCRLNVGIEDSVPQQLRCMGLEKEMVLEVHLPIKLSGEFKEKPVFGSLPVLLFLHHHLSNVFYSTFL